MRLVLVIAFLYFIPLSILFKNYKNKRRTFIYGSMYIFVATTMVLTNIYTSFINELNNEFEQIVSRYEEAIVMLDNNKEESTEENELEKNENQIKEDEERIVPEEVDNIEDSLSLCLSLSPSLSVSLSLSLSLSPPLSLFLLTE